MKLTLVTALIFLGSISNAAVTGTAQMEVSGVGELLDYSSNGSSVTGDTAVNSNDVVNYTTSADNSGLSGTYGGYTIESSGPQSSTDGTSQTIELNLFVGGTYDYDLSTDSKGNLQINSVSNGQLFSATLSKSGEFYAGSGNWAFDVTPTGKTGEYEGSFSQGNNVNDMTLTATGALDLATLAQSNPTLFLALYILPFQETH